MSIYSPKGTWTSSSGMKLDISEMHDEYLLNAFRKTYMYYKGMANIAEKSRPGLETLVKESMPFTAMTNENILSTNKVSELLDEIVKRDLTIRAEELVGVKIKINPTE